MKEGENDSGSVTEYKVLGERIYVRFRASRLLPFIEDVPDQLSPENFRS